MTTTQITEGQTVTVHATNGRRMGTGTVRTENATGLIVDYTDTRGTKRAAMFNRTLVRAA